ncbi:hypothetical protein CAPTEDRAFT_203390 [Capitella teleta]|uniref:G-protein coupled receptors family 3 profile domain-containing protein n=1 Tax=Capitella teleta TaxID=283909 RepID=R7VA80_CAPTE|nr:hypothetical protein CAPTEDRAFT_203390 [Capitella teleta]|eukprot:ELU15442.1 hypothetical protein CAPTEDRAFT_203390 [Capitella teleta]
MNIALLVTLFAATVDCQFTRKKNLYFMGLLPYSGNSWPAGFTLESAMHIALDEINSDESVLAEYELKMVTADTQCNVGKGMHALYEMLHDPPTKVAIIGPGCSQFCIVCAQAAPMWNLTLISPSCESDRLNDRSLFPTFFRTAVPNSFLGPTRIAIMEEFGWRKASFVHDSDASFSQQVDVWKELMKSNNMTILSIEVFQSKPALHIRSLKDEDARIIFTACPQDMMVKFICEAYTLGLYGPTLQFFFPRWYSYDWWKQTECPEDHFLAVIDHAIYLGSTLQNPTNSPSISGLRMGQLQHMVQIAMNETLSPGFDYMPFAYDAVWSAALALNLTSQTMASIGINKTLDEFTYADVNIKELMLKSYYEVDFMGIRDRVTFSQDGNSPGIIGITQQIGKTREEIGFYHASLDDTTSHNIVWHHGGISWRGGQKPVDSVQRVIKREFVSSTMYFAMAGWAALGMVQDVCLLIFNIKFRKYRAIKLSSPNINNLVLIGCFIVHVTVLFADTDGFIFSPKIICTVRFYTLTLGFSVAFGAFFSKAWRVHVILTQSSKLQTSKHKSITRDVVVVPEVYACVSQFKTYFVGALYSLQGLVMLFGTFLAWETRNITVEALNDSKVIGICIYNVLVLSLVGTVITFTIKDDINMMYGFISCLLNTGTMLTASILLSPRNRGFVMVQAALVARVVKTNYLLAAYS